MVRFFDRFLELCQKKNTTPNAVAKIVGISSGSITAWKNGTEPRSSAVKKLADFFGVSQDYMWGYEEKTPAFTKKDERDIEKKLADVLDELENGQDGLMFSGEAIDDTTRELLAASLRNSMEMGKMLAKQKFTPKKYRKDE